MLSLRSCQVHADPTDSRNLSFIVRSFETIAYGGGGDLISRLLDGEGEDNASEKNAHQELLLKTTSIEMRDEWIQAIAKHQGHFTKAGPTYSATVYTLNGKSLMCVRGGYIFMYDLGEAQMAEVLSLTGCTSLGSLITIITDSRRKTK